MKRLCLFIIAIILIAIPVHADDKSWTGSGDGTSYSDEYNWFPAGAPNPASDAAIDENDASVEANSTFYAKSITVGGRNTSTMTVNKFIYGTVEPSSVSDTAVMTRPGGKTVLKGSVGTVTLKGQYVDSEESVAEEPSFVFWAG